MTGMVKLRLKWVAWLLLFRFRDLDVDPDVPDQPTEMEEEMADSLAMAISGAVTALAADMPKDLLARAIAQELRRTYENEDEPDDTFEAMVANYLEQLAGEWAAEDN